MTYKNRSSMEQLRMSLAKKHDIQPTYFNPNQKEIARIQKIVSWYFDVSLSEMQVETRKREVVQSRQVAMYFSKNMTNASLRLIGKEIGNKDHATVLQACKTVTDLMDTDKRFKLQMDEIEKRLKK